MHPIHSLKYFGYISNFNLHLGKSIVELQVTGVKASLTKRSQETNIGLSVHSLLLVDALQTFGPNYELLVASHRNVMVDSMSGSLKGNNIL